MYFTWFLMFTFLLLECYQKRTYGPLLDHLWKDWNLNWTKIVNRVVIKNICEVWSWNLDPNVPRVWTFTGLWFSQPCTWLPFRKYITAFGKLRNALWKQSYQSFLWTMLWFTLWSYLSRNWILFTWNKMKNVIQSSGLPSLLTKVSAEENTIVGAQSLNNSTLLCTSIPRAI